MNLEAIRSRWPANLWLYYAAVALIAILDVTLAVGLISAWHTAQGLPPEQIAADRVQYRMLHMQMAPLEGLGGKVEQARTDIHKFYEMRIPASYSSIAADLGDLAVKSNVHLSRVQYTQAPAIESLAELRLDASLSGDYPSIMRFINGLERDKNFFVINALNLTGQQGGMVNVRLRVTTYLRAADAQQAPPDTGQTDTNQTDQNDSATPNLEGR